MHSPLRTTSEVSVALDRRVAYYGERLSENIARTPDGYLICKNAVIGRTGFQSYRVSEISDPEGLLPRDMPPEQELRLWRDPSEVFSKATIASFEGKSFTLTHPDQLLNPENDNRHNQGHVQNIRVGDEPLESGDMPLLADVIVKGIEAIRAIETGERELSCGYVYQLARTGDRWEQRNILGNHVALVQRARAGEEARINDSLPTIRKEPFVKIENAKWSWVKRLLGIGLQSLAKDGKPEELFEANAEVALATSALEEPREKVISFATDKSPKDAEKFEFVGKGSDGTKFYKLISGMTVDDDKKPGKDDGTEEEKKAAMDKRKKMHDALDAALDRALSGKDDDGDLKNFQKEVDGFFGSGIKGGDKETEKEAIQEDDDKHPEGCRCADCMKARDEKEENEEKKAEDAEIVRAEPVLAKEQEVKNAFDEATLARVIATSNLGMLKMLKPFVADSKDKKLIKAYDTLCQSLKKITAGGEKDKKGSYDGFLKSAGVLSSKANDSKKEYTPTLSQAETEAKAIEDIYKKTGQAQRDAYPKPH